MASNFIITPFFTPAEALACREVLAGAPGTAGVRLPELERSCLENGDEALARQWLTREERERFFSFGGRKRRLEWLGGRVAAKTLLLNGTHAGLAPQQMAVTTLESGRPAAAGVADLSISHSGDFAVALAVTSGRCGVDLQKTTPTVTRVRERFARSGEAEAVGRMAALGPEEALTLLWCAKEAVRKAAGDLPGFLEIGIDALELPAPGVLAATGRLAGSARCARLLLARRPGYGLAVAMMAEGAQAPHKKPFA